MHFSELSDKSLCSAEMLRQVFRCMINELCSSFKTDFEYEEQHNHTLHYTMCNFIITWTVELSKVDIL